MQSTEKRHQSWLVSFNHWLAKFFRAGPQGGPFLFCGSHFWQPCSLHGRFRKVQLLVFVGGRGVIDPAPGVPHSLGSLLSLLEAERAHSPALPQLQNSGFVPQTAAGVTEELGVT